MIPCRLLSMVRMCVDFCAFVDLAVTVTFGMSVMLVEANHEIFRFGNNVGSVRPSIHSLGIFQPVVQPALGILMIGSALGGKLLRNNNT